MPSAPRPRRSAIAGLVALGALAVACDGRPPAPPTDARPRTDTGDRPVDAAVPEDTQPPVPDAGDAASPPTDGEAPIDAGPPPPCSIAMDIGAMVVGRDSDTTRLPRIVTAASPTEMVAILSDDAEGARRVQLIRQSLTTMDPVSRQALEGIPEGAGAPAIARVGDGWLVAYETPGGGIALQRYGSGWTPVGTAVPIAATGSWPALAPVGTAAYAAWREGTRLMGRALMATGAPSGAAVELGVLPSAGAGYTLQRFGRAGEALAAIGSAETVLARAMARRISATGMPAPGSIMLGATEEAAGSIAVGAAAASAPAGTAPLDGAASFDVRVGGFAQVRFVLLSADGMPAFGEFTVSDPAEPSWGAGVTPFRDGYVVAYRARPEDRGFSRVRIAFMDRDSCRLGRVDSRLTADVSASERGGAVSIASEGNTLFAGWAELLADSIEYRVVTAWCD